MSFFEPEEKVEYDEFGLRIRKKPVLWDYEEYSSDDDATTSLKVQGAHGGQITEKPSSEIAEQTSPTPPPKTTTIAPTPASASSTPKTPSVMSPPPPPPLLVEVRPETAPPPPKATPVVVAVTTDPPANNRQSMASVAEVKMFPEAPSDITLPAPGTQTISEYSHQAIVPRNPKPEPAPEPLDPLDGEWQEMPAYATHDMWDDQGRLIARAHDESDDEGADKNGTAAKGYTRVFTDEDAESVTSMDENTKYLFNEDQDDEASRNPLSQMQATKDLLTEGQRIAYVGVCKLALAEMTEDLLKVKVNGRRAKKNMSVVVENMRMWSQKIMVRLYTHMEISPPGMCINRQDLTPTLTILVCRADNDRAAGRARRYTLRSRSYTNGKFTGR